MVEVTRLGRDEAPKDLGVDYVKRKHKTDTKHSYAHEDIRRTKFDRDIKLEVHKGLMTGTSFFNACSDEDWDRIFKKVGS